MVNGTPLTSSRRPITFGAAAEALLPETMADHGDVTLRAAAAHIVPRRERAAGDGVDAERVEETAADVCAGDRIDAAGLREIEPLDRPGGGALEQAGLPVADLLPDRIGPIGATDDHQLLRLADRQGPEHEAVEDREERGIRADAERRATAR